MVEWVTLGFVDGKRKQKRIYGKNKRELQQKKKEILIQFEAEPIITFGAYKNEWLELKSSREKATIEMYENAMKKTDSLDKRDIKEIRTSHLQKIINDHYSQKRTCAILRLFLKQVFSCAIQDGLIDKNPAQGLQIPKQVKSTQRALTKAETQALKEVELPEKEHIFLMILYYLGLRPGEVMALESSDIDFTSGDIHISHSLGYNKNIPYKKSTKTGEDRTVPIPDALRDELLSYANAKTLLFPNNEGTYMTKSGMYDMWRDIKKEISKYCDTSNLRPYHFRHDYCTRCFYLGLSPLMTSKLMGNSVKMVMEVYAHIDEEKEPLDRVRKMGL